MTKDQLTHYQAVILNPHCIRLLPSTSLTPVILLPNLNSDIINYCSEILQVHGIWLNLTVIPWPNPDLTHLHWWYQLQWEGTRYVGMARVRPPETIWATFLPPGTTAQRTELIPLTNLYNWKNIKLSMFIWTAVMLCNDTWPQSLLRRKRVTNHWRKTFKSKQKFLSVLWLPWLAII